MNRPVLERRWTEPAPVIAVGVVAFVIAALVCTVVERWNGAVVTCWTGAAVGAVGFTVFLIQRRAARRGDRGAQRGLV